MNELNNLSCTSANINSTLSGSVITETGKSKSDQGNLSVTVGQNKKTSEPKKVPFKFVIKCEKNPGLLNNSLENQNSNMIATENQPGVPLNLSHDKTKTCLKQMPTDVIGSAPGDREITNANECSLIISNVSSAKIVNDGAATKNTNSIVSNSFPIDVNISKRGRKKKICESVESNQVVSKVADLKEYNSSSTANTNVIVSNILTRTIKIEPEEIEVTFNSNSSEFGDNESKPEQPPEKKKRGRPRKSLNPDCKELNKKPYAGRIASNLSDDKVIVRRGRGRPKKIDVMQGNFNLGQNSKELSSSPDFNYRKFINITTVSATTSSQNRRKVIKPRRFGSYESFEFMDVNDRNSFSPSDRSAGNKEQEEDNEEEDDDDDAPNALRIAITEECVDEENENEEIEENKTKAKATKCQNSGGDGRKRGRKRGTVKLVKCGVCKEEMSNKDYENKHMEKHNYITWLEGETPLDATNETDIVSACFKARRIRKKLFNGMKCEKCGDRKKSGVGYFSHIQTCGMSQEERNQVKVSCKLCGRVMLPCSLKIHMGVSHKDPDEPVLNLEEEDINVIPLGKRAAAAKAESKMEEVLADEKEIPIRLSKLKKLYKRKNTRLHPHSFLKWKAEMKHYQHYKCFLPNCSFIGYEISVMKKHFYECQYAVRICICKICTIEVEDETEMQRHIISCHKDAISGDKNFDGQNDHAVSEEEAPVPIILPKIKKMTKKGVSDKAKFIRQTAHRKNLFLFFSEVLKRTYIRTINNLCIEPIFEEFVAPLDEVLSEDESKLYIPSTMTSIKFSSENANWKQLDRFKSCEFEDTKLMFVGGPVWAVAWCPVPIGEKHQYLAVACHPNMNMVHLQESVHSYSSMIQIWDCGILDNMETESKGSLPTLKLGIAHDNGAVWSLQWCPEGCYQPSYGRLGLLAAAFSNGKVFMYSVPSRISSNDRLPIIKSKPVLELQLVDEEPAQCTRIGWSLSKPFNLVVCGYSDGLVAVFDLTTQSPLLRTGNILYPCQMFQPHAKPITSLHFLPTGANCYLLTVSSDRHLKFWNLADTTSPVSVSHFHRVMTITDVAWLNNWLCSVTAYDDALGYGFVNVSVNNFRDYLYGQPVPLMSQNSLNWSISSNDWLNALATSSEAGELVVLQCRQMFFTDDKSNKRDKKYFTKTELCRLDGEEKFDSKVKLTAPVSYEDASENYGLIMKSNGSYKCSSSTREVMSKTFYQIKSINKVVWNPNCQSFLFLAAGYHCGFVQIFRDKSFDNIKLTFRKFYAEVQRDIDSRTGV